MKQNGLDIGSLDYSRAALALNRHRTISPVSKYEDLKAAAEKARHTSREARLALQHHRVEHGC